LFGQDDWRLRPNLTLSLGWRWEDESIIRDLNNFAPRIAVPTIHSNRTVIRLGADLFLQRALLRTIDDFALGMAALL
jgi:outer membrane receptor protein involved in Fe transport